MTFDKGAYGAHDMRVIVLLPQGPDTGSILRVLEEMGVDSMMCATSEELCAEIERGAGALVIEEQVLSTGIGACLHALLDRQPSWSEMPIIVLLSHGPETQVARDALLLHGDVSLVERPVRVNTLVAVVRSALRSRHRQYVVRDQLLALEQSERRYRQLFNSMDEGFCIIEMILDEKSRPIDFRFLERNPSFEKHTGFTNSKGNTIREFVPRLQEYWFEIYGRVALSGESVRFQNRAEELHRWYDVYAFRVGQPEERQVAILFNDITEAKEREEALRTNEELLKTVLETLPVAVFILDHEGKILLANQAAHEIWAGARYVGMDEFGEYKGWWLDSGTKIEAHEWSAARAILRGETSLNEEVEIESFDGKRKILLNSSVPIKNEKGEITGAISVNQDITARKRAETGLQMAKAELEVRVQERTAELSSALEKLLVESTERLQVAEELRRKEQLLMQQNRLAAMGEMLVNISHQWRQPLNVLGLLLQELNRSYQRGTLTKEFVDVRVSRAKQVIAHMSQTIDDFRNFLNPDKIKVSFNVKEVVETTLSMIKGSFKEIMANVQVVAEDNVFIEGYRNEYAQAVMNILVNARDVFRDRNVPYPHLVITVSRESGRSVVTFTDNAGGIASDVIGRIFDPYFTTKAPDKGTGIGLFMSKMIIERHMAGRLTACNVGEGAEFRIEV